MVDDHDAHQARIVRLDVLIERAKGLPSLPDLAHGLQTLAALTARVEALGQECDALCQRELLRFWESAETEDD